MAAENTLRALYPLMIGREVWRKNLQRYYRFVGNQPTVS
jgi:hypothetical protein